MKWKVYAVLAFFIGMGLSVGAIALVGADASVDRIESRVILDVDATLASRVLTLRNAAFDPLAGAPELPAMVAKPIRTAFVF